MSDLPPLPAIHGGADVDRVEIWALMREYATAAVLAERDRCALIAEEHETWRDNPAHSIAADIRADTKREPESDPT